LYFIISPCMFVLPFVLLLGAFCHLFWTSLFIRQLNKRILDWTYNKVRSTSIINSNQLITNVLKNFLDLQGVTVWLVFLCICLYLLQTLLFIMLVFYLWTSVLRRVIGLSGGFLILICSFFLFFLADIDVYFFLFLNSSMYFIF